MAGLGPAGSSAGSDGIARIGRPLLLTSVVLSGLAMAWNEFVVPPTAAADYLGVGAPGERVQYLRVKVVLEVKEEKQVEAIKPNLPRVTDLFQTYLREVRPEELRGSAGTHRLREELIARANLAAALVRQGRKVLVLDADLGLPLAIGLLFQLLQRGLWRKIADGRTTGTACEQ
mgnify:CR=1 FL=1